VTTRKENGWGAPHALNPHKTIIEKELARSASGVASKGYRRELLPDPLTYYEGQGLTLTGRNSPWRTTKCMFHGGSDCMRIMLASGGFICMAGCGASGGDVLAYHMAAYCLSFVDAAKQLGAWVGDVAAQRHIRPTRISARDALVMIGREATLVGIEAVRTANGIPLEDADLQRLLVAGARVDHALRALS